MAGRQTRRRIRNRVWGFQQRMFSIGKCAFINLKTYNKVICCGQPLGQQPAASSPGLLANIVTHASKESKKKKEQGGGQGEGQDEGSTANRTDSKVSKTDTDTESGQKWTSGQATSALATTNGQGK